MFDGLKTWLKFWESESERKRKELTSEIELLERLIAYDEQWGADDVGIFEQRVQRLKNLREDLQRINFYKN